MRVSHFELHCLYDHAAHRWGGVLTMNVSREPVTVLQPPTY